MQRLLPGLLLLTLTIQHVRLFELSVIHINDFHGRFDQTNLDAEQCEDQHCIGGISRLYTQIMTVLEEKPDSLVLNGGDNFQGTLYYTLFKWNITQEFLNKIPFDAIVLGNHEFDDGIDGVVPFIKHLKAPVIVANIDDREEPSIQNLYKKSVVVERNGKKIGIIGALVKTTNEMSSCGKLKFYDEAESVIAEAERLAEEEGVFTNVVLSHIGYDIDQELASKATKKSKIGLIVGGHSHTFLYSGEPVPGPDVVRGPYPTIVKERSDGENVVVVQASAYCKYLGNISVFYDESGNVQNWSGAPIYLDTHLPQDSGINADLAPWKKQVDSIGNKVLGSTLVTLAKKNCYTSECLIGNFVTDAMVFEYTSMADSNSWTYAALAVMNPGGLRTTLEKGNITYNDLITSQPFGNTVDVGEIQGKYLKEIFEFCVKSTYDYGRIYVNMKTLQISGFHLVFDLTKPEGARVVSIKVRCNECLIPIYEDLDEDRYYRLITPSFLTRGGDGFTTITKNLKNVTIGRRDIDVFTDYLAIKSPIFEEIEGRIQIIGDELIETRNMF